MNKKALALAFAFTFSVAGAAVAQDAAHAPKVGETRGTVRWVEVGPHAIVLEDGTRLSVSDKQIADIWVGDQVKAGYMVTPDGAVVVTGMQVDRFSIQQPD